MTSVGDSEDPDERGADRGPAEKPVRGGGPEASRPEPLRDEIAKEARSSSRGAAQLEVRLRRLILLFVVLIPLIWWIVTTVR